MGLPRGSMCKLNFPETRRGVWMFKRIAPGFLLLAATSAVANDHALEALASAAGDWEGELYYLDYQSGQRFGIPMRTEIEATPDGATVIRRLTWTDPGNLVYAVALTTIDRNTGELVEAFFRDGKGEYMRYDVASATIESATKWQVVYEHDWTDADRPARIRHTVERDGDLMTSKKSVRFLDGDDSEFFTRNGSELRRVEVAH